LIAYVGRQRPFGYRLLAAWKETVPVALAGYRRQENLVHGPHPFVDDLVAAEGERGPIRWRSASTTAKACSRPG
jgi:hypothetical protein